MTDEPVAPAIIAALAKLRDECTEDIGLLEQMDEQVIKIRRRLRAVVQQADILEKMVLEENAGLRRSNEDLAAELATERHRSITLDREVSRLQALLLERPSPRSTS